MNKGKEIEVEISNGGPKGCETAVTLELPATWAEFYDAVQKARIEDERHCDNEVVAMDRNYLRSSIARNANLLELNLLAQRLAGMTADEEHGFEGLLAIERSLRCEPIPLTRLLTLAFNTDRCLFVPGVSSDRALGEFLLDSGGLSKEASRLLNGAEPDSDYRDSLLEVFGKKHREDRNGVFTQYGYAQTGSRPEQVLASGETDYFDRTGAPVVLEVSCAASGLTTTLDLPACEEAIKCAVEAVNAASAEACGFRCVDCLFPAARLIVDNAIREGGVQQADDFARLLAAKERVWDTADQVKYKALLEVSACVSPEDAAGLAEALDQYEVKPEIVEPWDYAECVLRERYPDLPPLLFQTSQAYQVGLDLLEQDHAAMTSYGMIRRKDRQPLPEPRRIFAAAQIDTKAPYRFDKSNPQPEPLRKVGEMEEGKPYWMTGIDQFCSHQVFLVQGKSIFQCPVWCEPDGSILFSDVEDEPPIYTEIDRPAPDMTLKDVSELFMDLYEAYTDHAVPANTTYEYIESPLLPDEFGKSRCEASQAEAATAQHKGGNNNMTMEGM